MIECIDKTDLAYKITQVLIQTQFQAWIEYDAYRPLLSAEELELREKRAENYFVGYSKDGKPSVEQILAHTKFHAVIQMQTAMIMGLLDG